MTRLALLAVVGLMSAAWAGSSAAFAQAGAKAQAHDPNAKVCETVSQVGSRLSKKKICATRAEWAEMKRNDREVVDQAQRAAQIGCSISPASTNGPVPAC
jgi:hypothetical protein